MEQKLRQNHTFDSLLSVAFAFGVLAVYLCGTPKFINVHGAMGGPLWPTTAFLFQHYQSLAIVPIVGTALFWGVRRIRGVALVLSIALSIGMLIFMIVAVNFSTAHGWPLEVESVQ